MVDAAEGQRALGGLGSLWLEIRLGYQVNEDFEEEMAYTTDRWLRPDEMEGVKEGNPPLVMTSPSDASTLDSAAAQEDKNSSARSSSPIEDLHPLSTVALSTELANLSVVPEVLGTFLATVGVPRHLLVQSSPSPPLSPSSGVRVPLPEFSHLTMAPTSTSPPPLPKERATRRDS
jgi:hypothetical protein